jgi:hypothetical protein
MLSRISSQRAERNGIDGTIESLPNLYSKYGSGLGDSNAVWPSARDTRLMTAD